MIKVIILAENYVKDPICKGEWGLALYIETDEMTLLFDTGASPMMIENAKVKGVDLSKVDACIISHGHFDHTGGLLAFFQKNDKAPVYVHKDAFGITYGEMNGQIDNYNCGILWNKKELEPYKDRLYFTDGPVRLSDNIVVSGTIPDIPNFKPVEKFYRISNPKIIGDKCVTKQQLIPDTMSHEQFLGILDIDKGITLFSGCSHKGIIAAVEYGKNLFPEHPLYAVVAGMHLIGADNTMRGKVINKLMNENPSYVVPLHCTGLDAVCMMKAVFGKKCLLTGTGGQFKL